MNTLQLSNATKNKILNNVFKPSSPSTLYVMIPAVDNAPQSADLPIAPITFSAANNGQISLAEEVQLSVQSGTTVNAVYIHTSPLTNGEWNDALVRIALDDDDVETYSSNGVYIIDTINVVIDA